MKVKIALINPNCGFAVGVNKATVEPPIGIAYLAAYLSKNRYDAILIDANILNLTNEQIKSLIDPEANIIGISFNVVSAMAVPVLVGYLRSEFPKALLLCGGPHPSTLPQLCLERFGFDAVCIGEGEESLLEVVRNLEVGKPPFVGVKGIYYKDKSIIVKNPDRNLISDIDSLPFPRLDLLPNLKLYKSRTRANPAGVILCSRGCPFGCIYCNKSIFRRSYRSRTAENIIAEIEWQINELGIKQIDFLDDNLTLDMEKSKELFRLIIARKFNIFINMQNGVRADSIDEPLVKLMKSAGVFKVSMGVESGDENIQKIIKKALDLKNVLNATRLFKKYGIKVYGNFMMGLPGDNAGSMQKTIDFAKKMNPDVANFMITIPLPGTELYDLIKNDGVLFNEVEMGMNGGFYAGKVNFSLKSIDTEKVVSYYRKAYRSFYLRPGKIIDLILSIRNFSELKWLFTAGIDTLKPMFNPK